MPSPGAPPPGFIYPVLTPGDIEWMALYFLTPLMFPTPVATRLPNDTMPQDTVNGFLRVEAGGGVKRNLAQYNQTLLLHTYVPDQYEAQGAEIANKAIAYMGAATGVKIAGRQIADVPHVSTVQRRTDPAVNLLRYLSFVTWTVSGEPVACALRPEPVVLVAHVTGSGALAAETTT